MTRNCLNVMRKIASLNKLEDHPSKYPNRQAWMNNAKIYSTLNSVDREEALAEDWDDWEKENRMRNYAKQTGQPTNNMSATFSRGNMTSFNGSPVNNLAQQQPAKPTTNRFMNSFNNFKNRFMKPQAPAPAPKSRGIETFDWIYRE